MQEILRIPTRVKKLEEHFTQKNWRKDGNDTLFDNVSLGWYVLMEGSREHLFVGPTKPEGLEVGDTVFIIIAKKGAKS